MSDKLPELSESPFQREAAEKINKELGNSIPDFLSSEAGKSILDKYEEAEEAKHSVEELSSENVRDSLTGTFNRRYFETRVSDLNRGGNMFGIVMFDLDHFKKVNDTYVDIPRETLFLKKYQGFFRRTFVLEMGIL